MTEEMTNLPKPTPHPDLKSLGRLMEGGKEAKIGVRHALCAAAPLFSPRSPSPHRGGAGGGVGNSYFEKAIRTGDARKSPILSGKALQYLVLR
jgi:hypothetical protein